MKRSQLATIFVIVFIDILGFSLILPLVPYYTDRYGATDLITGLLIGSFALAQLIGAPLLGRLSDRYGRRPILLVSIAGTVASLLMFGWAEAIGGGLAGLFGNAALFNTMVLITLFAARISDGLTGGNISVAQAYITDVTDRENRAKGLALVGVAFGLGFIVGPATGGWLSTNVGLYAPAFIAAGIATINWLMVFFLLPESHPPEARADSLSEAEGPRRAVSIKALTTALRRPLVGTLLYTTFFFGMAFTMLQTIFTLYALRRFGLNELQNSLILTFVGVLSVVVQGGLIGPLTKRFSEFSLIVVSIGVMAVGLLIWAFAPNVAVVLISLVPIAASGGVMNVVLRSTITKVVDPGEVGGILGIQTASESLTRAIGPVLGGWLIGTFGTSAPGVVGAAILLIMWPFVWRQADKGQQAIAANNAQAEPAAGR